MIEGREQGPHSKHDKPARNLLPRTGSSTFSVPDFLSCQSFRISSPRQLNTRSGQGSNPTQSSRYSCSVLSGMLLDSSSEGNGMRSKASLHSRRVHYFQATFEKGKAAVKVKAPIHEPGDWKIGAFVLWIS